jgi:hypothetical protein
MQIVQFALMFISSVMNFVSLFDKLLWTQQFLYCFQRFVKLVTIWINVIAFKENCLLKLAMVIHVILYNLIHRWRGQVLERWNEPTTSKTGPNPRQTQP